MLTIGDEAIPGYRLQEVIGSGSFGEVWKARGPGGTLAALKFINLRADYGPKELRAVERIKEIRCAHLMPVTAIWLLDQSGRLLDDTQAMRCLARHTTSLESALEEGAAAPVTLVVGMPLGDQSLADRLRQCRAAGLEGIPPAELLDYIDDVAQGIDYLHAPRREGGAGPAGLQHGDVKPRNIMLVGGAAQLCDFGLARVLGESATATCMGGTPAYVAPECLRDRRYSHATDQYSLAITYHELRTGRLPFDAESISAILEVHKNSLLSLDRLPPGERAVVRRATSLEPAARYASCQEFARALRLAAEPVCGVGVSPAQIAGADVNHSPVHAAPVCGVGVSPAQIAPPARPLHNALRETPAEGSLASTPVESTLTLTPGSSPHARAMRARRPLGRRTKRVAGLALLALFGAAVSLRSLARDAWRWPPMGAGKIAALDETAPAAETTYPIAETAAPQPTNAETPVESGAALPESAAPATPPANNTTAAASADDAAGDQPSPVPFPGDGIFNDPPPFLAGVTVDHADFAYREGDRLRVEFMAEREAHLYLVYHQADGQSRLLFPNVSQRDNRAPARQPVVLPGPDQPLRFRIQPPFGTEVLQVIATLAPAPELDGLLRGAAFPGRQNETGSASLAPLPAAPMISQRLLDELRARLLKEKTVWTEHRVLLHTEAKAVAAPLRKAARVGLFIGIGKYQRPDLCHTHAELANSAKVMHELMLKQGGLDPAKTKLVLNQQATKANLRQLITRWLPSVSQPGDVVFLYFSGHAGQYDTRDASELDGKDETIAPYDFDAGPTSWPSARQIAHSRASSILDDTLARWLQGLSGRQLVMIFDTCHSGGLVEGKGISVAPTLRGGETVATGDGLALPSRSAGSTRGNALRGVPPAAAAPLPPHPHAGIRGRGEGENPAGPLTLFTDEAARIKDISQLNTIVLTSCASDEQSLFEGIKNQTMWFTYCLTEAMTNPKALHPLTVQDAFNYSRLRMKQLLVEVNAGREQEPTMSDNVLLPVVLIP